MTVCIYRYIHATTLYYKGRNKVIVCVWEMVGMKVFESEWEEITVV